MLKSSILISAEDLVLKFLILSIFIIGCSKQTSGTGNLRSFAFTYGIQLEPAINKKLEFYNARDVSSKYRLF